MARIKITAATVTAKLTKWVQGQERIDELIYYRNEIDAVDIKQRSWDLGSMIVDIVPDTVEGFNKILFSEKL